MVPIVFLLRHPCAVAHSRLYQRWDDGYDDLLRQDVLVEDFLSPFVPNMRQAQTDFEKHIFLWCIENFVPLQQLRRGDALAIFYEDLCIAPEQELARLAQFLKIRFEDDVVARMQKPSSQSRKRASPIALGKDPIFSWQHHVTADMLTRATDILKLFGLDRVYGKDAAPLIGADALLQTGS